MAKTITLRETNQAFVRCVREVEAGAEYIITRKGRPVARLTPIAGGKVLTARQAAALARTRARMEKGWSIGTGPIDRDAVHGRD